MKTKMTGIYKIQSKVKPGRIYIGSSIDMSHRWAQHKSHIVREDNHHPKLACHVKKYGIDDLEFSVIEQFEFVSNEYLLEREQYYIDTLAPWFNTCPKAGNTFGRRLSEETKAKLAEASRGNKNMLGKHLSAEAKTKISVALKGKKLGSDNPFFGKRHPNEIQERINAANKGRIPWNKGKTGIYSDEAIEKIRQGARGNHNRKGTHSSEETKEKIRESRKGSHASEETRAKMSRARRGRRHSEETKQRMSKSATEREVVKRLRKQETGLE